MSDILFAANEPYPEIAVSKKDTASVCLLSQDYAGVLSEMTAVGAYTYQSLCVENCDEQLSRTLAGISRVEMHHLYMLGRLIVCFGGDPQLREIGRSGIFCWNSRYIPVCRGIRQLLCTNIESEHKAIEQYERHIRQLNDEGAVQVLRRIIADEKLHLQILQAQMDKTE